VLDDAVIVEAGRRLSEAAPPSSRVILFGSAARGELTRDSDLDFLVIEPEVENPALESVRLRRVLGDLVLAADVIVASEHRVQEWRDVRGSLIHAALAEGRELSMVAERRRAPAKGSGDRLHRLPRVAGYAPTR